jgi:hypothetical protein
MVRRAPRAWLAAAAARGAAGVAAAEAAEAAVAACADAALNLGPAPLGLPPLFQAPGPAPGLQEPPPNWQLQLHRNLFFFFSKKMKFPSHLTFWVCSQHIQND